MDALIAVLKLTGDRITSKLCPKNPNKWCWEEEERAVNDCPAGCDQMNEREEMTLTGGGLNTTTNNNQNDNNNRYVREFRGG
jgi:hypothetical protein